MFAPLMVLLEINAAGFAVFEFKSDTPRAVDVDRVAPRIETLQGMKVEAGNVHFLGSDGDVETVESCENAFMHLRVDLRSLAVTPKFRESLAFEGSDHNLA
jgi:hypothetical protein